MTKKPRHLLLVMALCLTVLTACQQSSVNQTTTEQTELSTISQTDASLANNKETVTATEINPTQALDLIVHNSLPAAIADDVKYIEWDNERFLEVKENRKTMIRHLSRLEMDMSNDETIYDEWRDFKYYCDERGDVDALYRAILFTMGAEKAIDLYDFEENVLTIPINPDSSKIAIGMLNVKDYDALIAYAQLPNKENLSTDQTNKLLEDNLESYFVIYDDIHDKYYVVSFEIIFKSKDDPFLTGVIDLMGNSSYLEIPGGY